jgi:hypothetical protein
MDEFSVNEDLSTYDADGLDAAIEQGNTVLDALLALDNPSDDDVASAERVAAALNDLNAEKQRRETAAAERTARMAALRDNRVEASDERPPAENEGSVEPDNDSGENDSGEEEDPPAPPPVQKATTRATLARRTERP